MYSAEKFEKFIDNRANDLLDSYTAVSSKLRDEKLNKNLKDFDVTTSSPVSAQRSEIDESEKEKKPMLLVP